MKDVLEKICRSHRIAFSESDFNRISWLSRQLGVDEAEFISMVVVELLGEKAPRPPLRRVVSRIHKRIVRDLKKSRELLRSDQPKPLLSPDDRLDLKSGMRCLSFVEAQAVEMALDGATVSDIANRTGRSSRTVYRVLAAAVARLSQAVAGSDSG